MQPPRTDAMRGPHALIGRITRTVRAIIGAPDYSRYLTHLRAKHPDTKPLSREEFARERERARYEGTGNRCC